MSTQPATMSDSYQSHTMYLHGISNQSSIAEANLSDPSSPLNLLASTPLLAPFQITKPYTASQTALLRILNDENMAYEAVLNLLELEGKLGEKLRKAKNEANQKEKDDANNKTATGKNKKKKRPTTKSLDIKIETLELQLAQCSHSLLAARSDLSHLSNFTRSALQCEYSKIVVTLSPSDERYESLEMAVDYLFDEEDRCVYFREMMGVMKKIQKEKRLSVAIVDLPLIKQFQCDNLSSPLTRSLMDELHQLYITEEVRVRCKDSTSRSKAKLLKYAEESLSSISGAVQDLIKKHYRKKSIKLHPDRKGEEFRPAFREFTDARDTLVNDELRQRYLKEMMNVYAYYGRSDMLNQSHGSWMARHCGKEIKDAAPKEEVRRLEGGLHQVNLKAPLVKEEGDRVEVSVPLPRPLYEFYSRVRSITVAFSSTHDVVYEMKMNRSAIIESLNWKRNEEQILPSQICVGSKVLGPGVWEITWAADLDTVGTDVTNVSNATGESIQTTTSYANNVIIEDRARMRNMQQFELLEWQCKGIKGQLSAALQKFNSAGSNRYGACHETLVRAAKMHRSLREAMDKVSMKSEVYDDLMILLDSSRETMVQMEDIKRRKEKKDDVRRFKAFMAGVLESKNPVEWIRNVTEMDLEREGGDLNRLYQLFAEGKGKCALLIDSEMLKEASLRGDLFSPKQCKELESRSGAVAVQEAKEEEEARLANEQRLKEEEAREKVLREAERRKNWEMVGNTVVIYGLESAAGKAMNQATAKVLYYVAEKDRFEIEIIDGKKVEAGKRALLKKENLTVKYFGRLDQLPSRANAQSNTSTVPKPSHASSSKSGTWNCTHCTLQNKEQSQKCAACSIHRWGEVEPTPSNGKGNASGALTTSIPPSTARSNPAPSPPIPVTPVSPARSASSLQNKKKASLPQRTVYVTSSSSKKLTGKKGKTKKSLEVQSGAKLDIRSSDVKDGYVPVCVTGSDFSINKALVLIRDTAGHANFSQAIPAPKPAASTPSVQSAPAPTSVQSEPANRSMPSEHVQSAFTRLPVAHQPVEPSQVSQPSLKQPPQVHRPMPSMTSFVPYPEVATTPQQSKQESEANPRQLFQPPGFQMSPSELTDGRPSEMPSEIGIRRGLQRDTDGSVSSLNDRSQASRTMVLQPNFTLPDENDPLLVFLRGQQACIKGSADEFFMWLVKSEDVDSMEALKEAIGDEDYLAETLKVGNGSVGIKGFKRKAFQRAVLDYQEAPRVANPFPSIFHQESKVTDVTASTTNSSDTNNVASVLRGMESNAFLPSFLYNDSSENTTLPSNVSKSKRDFMFDDDDDAPPELICPITQELMTEDPVLAADGVTYERSAIENWFHNQIAVVKMAQEQLKANPNLHREQEIVKNGIRSPAYGTPLNNLFLTPNTGVRNMARAHKLRASGGLDGPSPVSSMFRFVN